MNAAGLRGERLGRRGGGGAVPVHNGAYQPQLGGSRFLGKVREAVWADQNYLENWDLEVSRLPCNTMCNESGKRKVRPSSRPSAGGPSGAPILK